MSPLKRNALALVVKENASFGLEFGGILRSAEGVFSRVRMGRLRPTEHPSGGEKNDNSPAARTCFYMTLRLNFKLIFSKQPVFVVKANLSINISNMKKL